MKVWTVYQVENRINGRLYIGVHKTVDPNDEYLGSGKLIHHAIKKHGLDNFRKEVLLVTENKAEAFALEKSLVTLERIESGALYNLKEGGEGGWDFCNKSEESIKKRVIPWSSGGHRAQAELRRNNPDHARIHLQPALKKMIQMKKEGLIPHSFTGLRHSEETKRKMSESKKVTSAGSRNSQFGSIWVNDGSQVKKIRSSDPIPEGWVRGRKLMFR